MLYLSYANKCYIANNNWHFNIYEQDKFRAQLSLAWKKFYNPEISLSFGGAGRHCHEPGQIHCFLAGLENGTRPLVFTSVSGCRASEYFDISTEN